MSAHRLTGPARPAWATCSRFWALSHPEPCRPARPAATDPRRGADPCSSKPPNSAPIRLRGMPSSRARAASRRASTPRSTAGSARRTIRPGAREPAPHGRGTRHRAGGAGQRPSGPLARCGDRRGPWRWSERPKADGMVTRVPGLALAVTTADCGPVLFADPHAGVIGAAHAGWRGALTGVLEATIAAMEGSGAARGRIVAVLGPTISQAAYEVGSDLMTRFIDAGSRERALLRANGRPAMRSSTCRPISARGSRRRDRRGRRSRPLHLCRRRALLQLPPHDPPRRSGLRRLISAIALTPLMPTTSGVSQARCWPPSTAIIWPVMLGERARNRTASAISSGVGPRSAGRLRPAWRNPHRPGGLVERRTRSDGVDADARGERLRHGAGRGEEGRLRQRVGEELGRELQDPLIDDVDDRAGAFVRQEPCEVAGQEGGCAQVDGEMPVPLRLTERSRRRPVETRRRC